MVSGTISSKLVIARGWAGLAIQTDILGLVALRYFLGTEFGMKFTLRAELTQPRLETQLDLWQGCFDEQ